MHLTQKLFVGGAFLESLSEEFHSPKDWLSEAGICHFLPLQAAL